MMIQLDRLNQLCGNNAEKKRKFLLQFLELVPSGMKQLSVDLKNGDREKVRKTIHFLAPQLAFFGIPDLSILLGELDGQPPVPLEKLKNDIKQSIQRIDKAVLEVRKMI